MNKPVEILVVGCGNMGTSHARAYHELKDYEITGLVSRTEESRNRLSDALGGYPTFSSLQEALENAETDAVSINTYPDSHAALVREALEANCHVFVEKPLATTVEEAEELVALAHEKQKVLMVGYILRVHPAWMRFVQIAQKLGKPLVMRMNLNQQSSGLQWHTHKQLMNSMSPLVDCGVHYVDIMCMMTGARPVSVQAIGARLTDEIPEGMYNYGQLQVRFDDGSIGWYEAGWGPMMSETAFFIKDVIGPEGSVSISEVPESESADIGGHTKTGVLQRHYNIVDGQGRFLHPDAFIHIENEPDHDGLCLLEQELFLKAIRENLDLTPHLKDAINSLKIVLAADASIRLGKVMKIQIKD